MCITFYLFSEAGKQLLKLFKSYDAPDRDLQRLSKHIISQAKDKRRADNTEEDDPNQARIKQDRRQAHHLETKPNDRDRKPVIHNQADILDLKARNAKLKSKPISTNSSEYKTNCDRKDQSGCRKDILGSSNDEVRDQMSSSMNHCKGQARSGVKTSFTPMEIDETCKSSFSPNSSSLQVPPSKVSGFESAFISSLASKSSITSNNLMTVPYLKLATSAFETPANESCTNRPASLVNSDVEMRTNEDLESPTVQSTPLKKEEPRLYAVCRNLTSRKLMVVQMKSNSQKALLAKNNCTKSRTERESGTVIEGRSNQLLNFRSKFIRHLISPSNSCVRSIGLSEENCPSDLIPPDVGSQMTESTNTCSVNQSTQDNEIQSRKSKKSVVLNVEKNSVLNNFQTRSSSLSASPHPVCERGRRLSQASQPWSAPCEADKNASFNVGKKFKTLNSADTMGTSSDSVVVNNLLNGSRITNSSNALGTLHTNTPTRPTRHIIPRTRVKVIGKLPPKQNMNTVHSIPRMPTPFILVSGNVRIEIPASKVNILATKVAIPTDKNNVTDNSNALHNSSSTPTLNNSALLATTLKTLNKTSRNPVSNKSTSMPITSLHNSVTSSKAPISNTSSRTVGSSSISTSVDNVGTSAEKHAVSNISEKTELGDSFLSSLSTMSFSNIVPSFKPVESESSDATTVSSSDINNVNSFSLVKSTSCNHLVPYATNISSTTLLPSTSSYSTALVPSTRSVSSPPHSANSNCLVPFSSSTYSPSTIPSSRSTTLVPYRLNAVPKCAEFTLVRDQDPRNEIPNFVVVPKPTPPITNTSISKSIEYKTENKEVPLALEYASKKATDGSNSNENAVFETSTDNLNRTLQNKTISSTNTSNDGLQHLVMESKHQKNPILNKSVMEPMEICNETKTEPKKVKDLVSFIKELEKELEVKNSMNVRDVTSSEYNFVGNKQKTTLSNKTQVESSNKINKWKEDNALNNLNDNFATNSKSIDSNSSITNKATSKSVTLNCSIANSSNTVNLTNPISINRLSNVPGNPCNVNNTSYTINTQQNGSKHNIKLINNANQNLSTENLPNQYNANKTDGSEFKSTPNVFSNNNSCETYNPNMADYHLNPERTVSPITYKTRNQPIIQSPSNAESPIEHPMVPPSPESEDDLVGLLNDLLGEVSSVNNTSPLVQDWNSRENWNSEESWNYPSDNSNRKNWTSQSNYHSRTSKSSADDFKGKSNVNFNQDGDISGQVGPVENSRLRRERAASSSKNEQELMTYSPPNSHSKNIRANQSQVPPYESPEHLFAKFRKLTAKSRIVLDGKTKAKINNFIASLKNLNEENPISVAEIRRQFRQRFVPDLGDHSQVATYRKDRFGERHFNRDNHFVGQHSNTGVPKIVELPDTVPPTSSASSKTCLNTAFANETFKPKVQLPPSCVTSLNGKSMSPNVDQSFTCVGNMTLEQSVQEPSSNITFVGDQAIASNVNSTSFNPKPNPSPNNSISSFQSSFLDNFDASLLLESLDANCPLEDPPLDSHFGTKFSSQNAHLGSKNPTAPPVSIPEANLYAEPPGFVSQSSNLTTPLSLSQTDPQLTPFLEFSQSNAIPGELRNAKICESQHLPTCSSSNVLPTNCGDIPQNSIYDSEFLLNQDSSGVSTNIPVTQSQVLPKEQPDHSEISVSYPFDVQDIPDVTQPAISEPPKVTPPSFGKSTHKAQPSVTVPLKVARPDVNVSVSPKIITQRSLSKSNKVAQPSATVPRKASQLSVNRPICERTNVVRPCINPPIKDFKGIPAQNTDIKLTKEQLLEAIRNKKFVFQTKPIRRIVYK